MRNEVFTYNNAPITFQLGNGETMANATEMSKVFGKNASHWLRNQSTQEFINELSALRNRKGSDLVTIENGVGCWMHEDVALEFARWLSPAFAIWCNDRIKELMRHGMTATPDTIEKLIANPDTLIQLATQLKEERAEKERIAEQKRLAEEQLQISAPKVQYYNDVLMSKSTYTTNQIAKELGMSAITLNKRLQELNVQYRQNGQWLLYSKYQDKGLTKTHTHTFTHSDGSQGTSMQTVWTEKGRELIHKLLAQ